MDATRKQRLIDAGIDVDDALARFMGNESLLDRFLNKFPADVNYQKLVDAVAAGAQEDALTASHTLKGVSGNLSMQELYDLTARQVAAMRAGDWQGAFAMMDQISPVYEKIISAITAQ